MNIKTHRKELLFREVPLDQRWYVISQMHILHDSEPFYNNVNSIEDWEYMLADGYDADTDFYFTLGYNGRVGVGIKRSQTK